MKNYTIKQKTQKLKTTESFIGESLEQKIRRVEKSGEPIEAISPMIYTERKDGVKPEYNIRTDKWEIAQSAMNTIAEGTRQKRQEHMKDKTKTDTATASNSKVNVQTDTQKQ